MDDLVGAAKSVLFDFDGPMCDLFSGHPAPQIAQRLRDLVESLGATDLLTPELRETGDPQVILHGLEPGSELADLLERTLTEEEVHAAKIAMPTAYADPLIRTLTATGRRVAITTNNSREAVESYLHTRGLAPLFSGHVHGRPHDLRLLKPHPDCLERALASTGTVPEKALMIGDTTGDLKAANAARVPFLGYAPRPSRHEELLAAGAGHVATSLEEVLSCLV